MSDQEKKASIPSWQKPASNDDGSSPTSQPAASGTEVATIEQARRFLDDDNVRDAAVEKKVEFLKSKGVDEQIIQSLLAEHSKDATSAVPSQPVEKPKENISTVSSSSDTSSSTSQQQSRSDTPPIITYPEFLTRPARPPPLITPSRLLNILSVSGTLWTMAYGASRFILNPMVQTRDEARTDYYSHVSGLLTELNEKLEGVVSEIPYKNGMLPIHAEPYKDLPDDDSSYDDPTELFHRDVGTQTSDLPTPASDLDTPGNLAAESKIDKQARQLSSLKKHMKDFTDMANNRADNLSNVREAINQVTEEAQKSSASANDYNSYSTLYGGPAFGRKEPDGEFKKCKDEVRSIKAMFLSARSFPAPGVAR